jgi:glycerol-3-phosphate cytidylyltransferase
LLRKLKFEPQEADRFQRSRNIRLRHRDAFRIALQKARPEMIRVGYAPGAFDLFHVGHLNLLRLAKGRCDYLIAGVVSDEMLRQNKGIAPMVPLQDRLEIVRNISFVDKAVAEEVPQKLQMWKALRFHVLFKGSDWIGTDKGERLNREFAPVGVEIVYLPRLNRTSSTALRGALQDIELLAQGLKGAAAGAIGSSELQRA